MTSIRQQVEAFTSRPHAVNIKKQSGLGSALLGSVLNILLNTSESILPFGLSLFLHDTPLPTTAINPQQLELHLLPGVEGVFSNYQPTCSTASWDVDF